MSAGILVCSWVLATVVPGFPDAPAPGDRFAIQAEPARPDLDRYKESEPIHIVGDGDHLIERKLFRPRDGVHAIRIDNHRQGTITIRDCLFLGPNGPASDGMSSGNGQGILAWQSSGLVIEGNHFDAIAGFCVRIMGSVEHPAGGVRVVGNRMVNLQAYYEEVSPWGWTADAIQFVRVVGPGNEIRENLCVNRAGQSYVTDFINVYCSSGTEESPLLVLRNTLVGAGAGGLYNQHGCGIQLNDHGPNEDAGEFVVARENLLIDPGIVGMNINGGYHITMFDNLILMSPSHRTNLARGPIREHPTWAALSLFN